MGKAPVTRRREVGKWRGGEGRAEIGMGERESGGGGVCAFSVWMSAELGWGGGVGEEGGRGSVCCLERRGRVSQERRGQGLLGYWEGWS